ncbi:MAG: hypothetical protein ACXW2U_10100 [Telluria sp.]
MSGDTKSALDLSDLTEIIDAIEVKNADADHIYGVECQWLELEIGELRRHDVKAGDGDQSSKATRVLEMAAKHLVEGRPSKVLMAWIATSFLNRINGSEPSLDHAFRLENPSHRPKKDPYSDSAIKAALGHIRIAGLDLSAEQHRIVRNEALDIAYADRWRATPKEDKAKGIDPETIRSRRRTIGNTLATLGY